MTTTQLGYPAVLALAILASGAWFAAEAPAQDVSITVDPNGYPGDYRIGDRNDKTKPVLSGSGPNSKDFQLEDDSEYYLRILHWHFDFEVVDGKVHTASRSASVKGNKLVFETIPVSIRPGPFAGNYEIAWGPGQANRRPLEDIRLLRDFRYSLAVGHSHFDFEVGMTGRVRIPDDSHQPAVAAASAFANEVQFNARFVNLRANYDKPWGVRDVSDVSNISSRSFRLLPGMRYQLLVGTDDQVHEFEVVANGKSCFVYDDGSCKSSYGADGGTFWLEDLGKFQPGTPVTGYNAPQDVAIMSNGHLAVASSGNGVLYRVDPSSADPKDPNFPPGNPWGSAHGITRPTGVINDGTNNLMIVEQGTLASGDDEPHLGRYDPGGGQIWGVGPSVGKGSKHWLTFPSRLALDTTVSPPAVLVADIGLQRLSRRVLDQNHGWPNDPAPTFIGTDELRRPEAVAVKANSDIWVADTRNERVVRFRPAGGGQYSRAYTTMAPGTGAGHVYRPRGIAVHGECIWVVDSGNGRVQVLDKTDVYVAEFGTAGPGPGQLLNPAGIAVGDVVYVADQGNNRIQVFEYPANWYLTGCAGAASETQHVDSLDLDQGPS